MAKIQIDIVFSKFIFFRLKYHENPTINYAPYGTSIYLLAIFFRCNFYLRIFFVRFLNNKLTPNKILRLGRE